MSVDRSSMSRRRFLRLGGAATVAAGGAAWLGLSGEDPPGAPPTTAGPATTGEGSAAVRAAGAGELILVTIQLEGGLDFLDTVVPRESARYRDLRRESGVEESALHAIDADFSLHAMPHLADRWAAGELAIVHGVGWADSTLSHFEDTDVWEHGTVDPAATTGWLGRSLAHLGGSDGDPLLGVSLGRLSPSMRGPEWSAVAIPEEGAMPWTAEFVEEHPELVRGYADLTSGSSAAGSSLADQVRASQALVQDVAGRVEGAAGSMAPGADREDDLEELDEYGEGGLGRRLGLVARLIRGGLPTRAFHVPHGADFDTHARQAQLLPMHLGELDSAIRRFQSDLGEHRDRVVIATWTEFGRRPDWNGDGTEHGTAGTQFVVGPTVQGGHHGEPVSLRRFDRDDNFVVTADFRDYLAGLSEGVLGVPADAALEGRRRPMGLVA